MLVSSVQYNDPTIQYISAYHDKCTLIPITNFTHPPNHLPSVNPQLVESVVESVFWFVSFFFFVVFLKFHIWVSEIIWYLSFSDLFHLALYSNSNHVIANGNISFLESE